jgi:predicted DCC family thiol-disulfide oxidoreductase YuxK
MPGRTPVLIYDGDCGFCTTSAAWIETRVRSGVAVEPWQRLDLDQLGLSEAEVTSAAYWIESTGRRLRGHRAVGRALEEAGPPYSIAGWLIGHRPLSWAAWAVYALVARYRYRLPGSTEACRLP